MSAAYRAELRLRWILGALFGLILGYAWGQYDANSGTFQRLDDAFGAAADTTKAQP